MNTTATGRPEPGRLRRAVAAAAAAYDPDQVILFGSGARGTMGPNSDIDLLIVKAEYDADRRAEPGMIEADGDEIDIVIMGPERLESRRRRAGTIEQEALEDGVTVYVNGGTRRPVVASGGRIGAGDATVRKSKLEPEQSAVFLRDGLRHWGDSRNTTVAAQSRCEHRQQAFEHALKGLTTAQGERVKHGHSLSALWDRAESAGERIPVERDEAVLEKLKMYAGSDRYLLAEDRARDELTLAESDGIGRELIEHAKEAIPRLARRTRAELTRAAEEPRGDSGPTAPTPPGSGEAAGAAGSGAGAPRPDRGTGLKAGGIQPSKATEGRTHAGTGRRSPKNGTDGATT